MEQALIKQMNTDPSFENLKGFEGYYKINKNGDLWSCSQHKFMKKQLTEDGYNWYKLTNGHITRGLIHRLLAIQYIPNPDNLPEIDHIDRNKLNNSLDNLRWVSRNQNRENRETKGCITTFQANEKTNYKASYAIEKGNIKQKTSVNKKVVEDWLETIKQQYPRKNKIEMNFQQVEIFTKETNMSNNDLKIIQEENIQMDATILPVEKIVKKRGRKPKPVPIPIVFEEINDTDDEEEKSCLIVPMTEEHKEKCECDLCQSIPIPNIVLISDEPKTKEMETQTDPEPEPEPELPCFECLEKTKRTKKDNPNYWKEYYAENKLKIDKQKKEWREKNKDKVNTTKRREYQKVYDAKNKEKIKERRERIILCECGEEIKHFSLKNHRVRSKTHKLKVELKIAKGEIIVPVQEFNEDDTSSTASSDLSDTSEEKTTN